MVSHMAWSRLHLPSVTQHLEIFNGFSEKSLFCQLYWSRFLEENKTRLGFFENFFLCSQGIHRFQGLQTVRIQKDKTPLLVWEVFASTFTYFVLLWLY